MLKEHPELKLTIEGHTDNSGNAQTNLDLSQRRAAGVAAFLVGSTKSNPPALRQQGLETSVQRRPITTPSQNAFTAVSVG
jgi:outer membrane protein OmpA-like peptidoglycan-associated protein